MDDNNEKRQQAVELQQRGHTNYAEIARLVGTSHWNVYRWLGNQHDAGQWQADRKRHAEFFGGLSPAEEYKRHAEKRAEINSKLEGECV